MADVREAILARLLEIVATIPTIRSTFRNNIDVPEDQLPTAVVFDGDEETEDRPDASGRRANRPTLVWMTPEIVIGDQSNEAGTDLSMLRRELIKRVLTDTALNEQIVRTQANGAIRYLACQTDVGWMRSLHGALRAQFLFKYVLDPNDL